MLHVFLLAAAVYSANGLTLEVTPATVVIGLTRHVEVNCSTSIAPGSGMASLISLIISSTNQSSFTELASINVFTSDSQVMLDVSDVTASGKIDNNGLSYIKLNWEYPDSQISGIYRCEANGVDHAGHPINFNTSQTVLFINPDTDALVKEIQYLTNSIENIYAKINEQNFNLTTSIEKVNALEQNILMKDNLWNARLEAIKNALFETSYEFDGRHYLLSRPMNPMQVDTAQVRCELFGGYLLEIDSSDEFEFARNLTLSYPKLNVTLTGGSYDAVHDLWVNRHSGSPVGYTLWSFGEPNQDGPCLYVTRLYMADHSCYLAISTLEIRYLCEIPE